MRQSVWREQRPNSQLFYCEKSNLFVINSYENILILDKDNVRADLHLRSSIEQLSYNDELKALCYMLIDGNVVVHWMRTGLNQVLKPTNKLSPVLYFDWLYSMRGTLDFFVVEATCVRFFRYEEDKRTLKDLKQVSIKVTSCWFETRTEVLACCNHAESGAIHIFHFNDKRSKNNYRGVSLVLDFDESGEPTKQEGPVDFLIKRNKAVNKEQKFRVEGTNKNKPLFGKPSGEQYFIQLVQLYERTTLLFYNVMEGRLKIYTLLEEQIVKVNLSIKLPSDSQVDFCVYDNLLVAHLKYDRISFIFDTKRNTSQTVATPMPLRCPSEPNVYECQFLDRWLVHPNRTIRKWVLDLDVVFNYLKQESDLFLFLIRRKNSKMIVLRWIRSNLFGLKVTILSSFWKYLFDEYVGALRQQDKARMEQRISPQDVYANIFYTVDEEKTLSEEQRQRFCDIVLECVRQMVEFRLEVPLKLQMMICRLLLAGGKYLLLYQLIQLKVIEDTRDLALSLIEDSKIMQQASSILQQVAVDILYRKELYRELLEAFAKLGLYGQLFRVAQKQGSKLDTDFVLSLGKLVAAGKRPSFVVFAKQFVRDFHPTVSEAYVEKELAAYLTAS